MHNLDETAFEGGCASTLEVQIEKNNMYISEGPMLIVVEFTRDNVQTDFNINKESHSGNESYCQIVFRARIGDTQGSLGSQVVCIAPTNKHDGGKPPLGQRIQFLNELCPAHRTEAQHTLYSLHIVQESCRTHFRPEFLYICR